MIHFTLFGIPVYIRPSFWVVLAIFGGALSINSVEGLIYPALFVIAGFVAILSHEMGHALVGRRLGGGQQTIVLELFGGLTSSHGMQLTRGGRALMILAGPMMTLLHPSARRALRLLLAALLTPLASVAAQTPAPLPPASPPPPAPVVQAAPAATPIQRAAPPPAPVARSSEAAPATPASTAAAPAGATMRCKDGLWLTGAAAPNRCDRNGGVAVILPVRTPPPPPRAP